MAHRPRLIVFVGSGVSYPSGLPCVNEITRRLLEDTWYRGGNERFYPGTAGDAHYRQDKWAPFLQELLKYLKSVADQYQARRERRPTTYEDLYSLVWVVDMDCDVALENPAVSQFVHDVERERKRLAQQYSIEANLPTTTWKARTFIQCVVHHCLYREHQEPRGFDALVGLALDPNIAKLEVTTLNHDLLVERAFERAEIEFVDGFSPERDGGIRWFDPSLFDGDYGVRLLKLHGSIDWFKLQKDGIKWGKLLVPWLHAAPKDGSGEFRLPGDFTPMFLTGTFTKPMEYLVGIHAEMMARFHVVLQACDTMIMSGYGWNDFTVNVKLMEWLRGQRKRRLVLLHEAPEKMKENSKSALRHEYGDLLAKGRIVPVRKWLCSVSSDDLSEAIT